jgi:hypothetical protein
MSAPSHEERHGQAGASTAVDPENLEVSPGFAHAAVQGWVPELASDEDVRKALETAFDYRGDVTITRKGGSAIGRDTAAGKSWEAWVRKYWEKKGIGEATPTLEPEPIE